MQNLSEALHGMATVMGLMIRVLKAETETQFVNAVKAFFKTRNDVTLPEHGWPWPWEDSSRSDVQNLYPLLHKAHSLAKCFKMSGNHSIFISSLVPVNQGLQKAKQTVTFGHYSLTCKGCSLSFRAKKWKLAQQQIAHTCSLTWSGLG